MVRTESCDLCQSPYTARNIAGIQERRVFFPAPRLQSGCRLPGAGGQMSVGSFASDRRQGLKPAPAPMGPLNYPRVRCSQKLTLPSAQPGPEQPTARRLPPHPT